MRRPAVEAIDGIPAAVAIDQSGAVKTSRSTVGTMTGINDYFKILFARCAVPVCPECRVEVTPENTAAVMHLRTQSVLRRTETRPDEHPGRALAPGGRRDQNAGDQDQGDGQYCEC